MCVFNGHAVAGGLLLGFVHDFIVMKKGPYITCLSEINLGFPINPANVILTKNRLDPYVSRLLVYGGKYNSDDSLKMGIVDGLYGDYNELKTKIH